MAQARGAGHEVLLQIPLEPFNYPTTDPGPHTLTVDASASENLDRLHWLLGRMTNYVGVVNYMGARFTGEADALSPVIAEIGKRGLLYLDDGSSARSRAAELAGAHAGSCAPIWCSTPTCRRRRSMRAWSSCARSPASAAMPSPPAAPSR